MRSILFSLVATLFIGCGTSDSRTNESADGTDGTSDKCSKVGESCTDTGACCDELVCLDFQCTDDPTGATSGDGTDAVDASDGSDNSTATDSTGGDTSGSDGTDSTEPVDCPPAIADRPPAISEHAGVWDPQKNRIVFHGGNPEFPVQCQGKNSFVGDTWAYWPACEQWELLPQGPSARGRASSVYDSKTHAMIMFGGRFREKGASGLSAYNLYDETWRLDLTNDTWALIKPSGTGPSARVNASAVYDPIAHDLVLFGGNSSNKGISYTPHNDLYRLDLDTQEWTPIAVNGQKPSPRLFAAAVYDSKRHAMIITTGGDANAFLGPFIGDTWSLDLETHEWTYLSAGGTFDAPARRIWGRTIYSEKLDRVILFGGHDDGELGNRNDLWFFDVGNAVWEAVQLGDSWNKPANGFCDFPADFANIVEGMPERRGSHLLTYSETDHTLMLHGGKTDCGLIDDVWTLDLESFVWTDIEPPSMGESCLRISDSCTSLCN